MNHKTETKQLLITLSLATICLLLSLYFPADSAFQKITRLVFFLLVIPVFYIKIILKEKLSAFGLNLKNKPSGVFWASIALLGILFSFYLIQSRFGLKENLLIPQIATDNFFWFVFYELVFINISLFCLEFFFRGFVLFSFLTKFSFWTILIQAILYIGSALLANASLENFLQSIVIAFFSGLLALKTRSFVYSYGIMLLASIMIDAYIIHSLK